MLTEVAFNVSIFFQTARGAKKIGEAKHLADSRFAV
jgi:hypothetical protein